MSEETGPTWFLSLLRTAQGSRWDRDLKGSNHVAGSVTLASLLSFLSPCCGIVCSLVLILAPLPERGKITQCLVPRKAQQKLLLVASFLWLPACLCSGQAHPFRSCVFNSCWGQWPWPGSRLQALTSSVH